MKNIKFLLFLVLIIGLSSCYKEESWVDKNVKDGGNSVPVIQNLSITNTPEGGAFKIGDMVNLDLQYWSIDEVADLSVYSLVDKVETLYKSFPFVDSYDTETGTQIQSVNYLIPDGTSGDTLTIAVIVKTKQDLARGKSVSVIVE